MKFDFSNPKFVGGRLTFPEKENPLLDVFKKCAFKFNFILKPNMTLTKNNTDIAFVKNWGHAIEFIMKDGSLPNRRFLRNKQDIEQFFKNYEKSTVREALEILQNSGYIIK